MRACATTVAGKILVLGLLKDGGLSAAAHMLGIWPIKDKIGKNLPISLQCATFHW